MSRKLYPIGIQTFERIRKEDMLYVDKTEYVYHMTHTDGKYFFLSRPRRFGKSLLTSTFRSYFEGRRDLFKGLAIERLETEWTEYPVLHFSMAGGKHMDKDQLERYLDRRLAEYEEEWGIDTPAADANDRLSALIMTAFNKTERQVVVLVDEYDAPLLDVVHEDEKLPLLRNVMRNFYSPLKDCEPYLRFVFLTGITKFSQMSIFSELNNMVNVSMRNDYAGICGITNEELESQMSADVDALAARLGMTREDTLTRLREYYDGYHFAAQSPDVYNPFSLLNAMASGCLDYYWFSTGTPTYLIEMLNKYHVMPSEIGGGDADKSEFDAPTERMTTITPLLYQSGYITIKLRPRDRSVQARYPEQRNPRRALPQPVAQLHRDEHSQGNNHNSQDVGVDSSRRYGRCAQDASGIPCYGALLQQRRLRRALPADDVCDFLHP